MPVFKVGMQEGLLIAVPSPEYISSIECEAKAVASASVARVLYNILSMHYHRNSHGLMESRGQFKPDGAKATQCRSFKMVHLCTSAALRDQYQIDQSDPERSVKSCNLLTVHGAQRISSIAVASAGLISVLMALQNLGGHHPCQSCHTQTATVKMCEPFPSLLAHSSDRGPFAYG